MVSGITVSSVSYQKNALCKVSQEPALPRQPEYNALVRVKFLTQLVVAMTEVELFPRGKTSDHGDSNLVSKKKLGDETRISRAEIKKGQKRKATVSPLVAGSDQDKDWLFGAPQTKRAVKTGGKSYGKGGDRQPSQPPATGNVKVGRWKAQNTCPFL